MKRLCLLVLAGVLSSTHVVAAPTPTPTPAPGQPYVVVQKDGSIVRLVKAPAHKGSGLVGFLWPNGELVIVRMDAVDEKRTADANRREVSTPATTTKVISQSAEAAGPKMPLGDRVRLVKPRAEAEKAIQSSSGTGKKASLEDLPERAEPGSRRKGKDGAEAGTGEAGEILDNNGRNEAWWRAKAEKVKNELADAEGELRLAQQEQDRLERSIPPPGQGATATWAMELQRLRNAVDRERARVETARRKLDDLAEAARVAGAYPGWVR